MLRLMQRAALAALLLALAALAVILLGKAWADRTFYDGYDLGAPLNAELRSETEHAAYRQVDLAIDGAHGARIPLVLFVPRDAAPPYPCVVFLHGINQDKAFTARLAPAFVRAGFALAGFDQYTRGERALPESATGFQEALAFRQRAARTVLDTRRVLDYLTSRTDIAGHRLYLAGASYGAITGATATAFDQRVRAAALVYGGGDLPVLLDSPAAHAELGDWHLPAATAAWWWLAPADPVRYVHLVAPRPLLLLNGREDPIIPPEAAEALYRAARGPKEQVWLQGGHLEPGTPRVEEAVSRTVDWLRKVDRDLRDRPRSVTEYRRGD